MSQKQNEIQKIAQTQDQTINELVIEIENAALEFLGNDMQNQQILNKIKLSKFMQAVRHDIKRELVRTDIHDF